ncbi:MAG: hypothetical protein F7C07_04770 [Desulfurococcales archaeon]|nr:hypothetical protein [Desulfurococcales archaeon]
MSRDKRDTEVLKVELPAWLAERFRRYVAERYGFRRGALSRAMIDLIERELGLKPARSEHSRIDPIVGLGLRSEYKWDGEDLVEALRRRTGFVPGRR